MGTMSWVHWLIVLLVVVLVFGTKKLRNLGTDLGSAYKSEAKSMDNPKIRTIAVPARFHQST